MLLTWYCSTFECMSSPRVKEWLVAMTNTLFIMEKLSSFSAYDGYIICFLIHVGIYIFVSGCVYNNDSLTSQFPHEKFAAIAHEVKLPSHSGMEKPFWKTPIYGVISVSIDTSVSNHKPLPPSPSTVSLSSVYSTSEEEKMNTHQRSRKDAILPPHIFLQPSTYSSSTSGLPDPIPLRPQLARNEQLHPASDWSVEKQRAQKARSENLPLSSHEQIPARLSGEYPTESPSKLHHNGRAKSAEQHAGNHECVLHTRSCVIPSFNPESYNAKLSPSAMTSRITDVVDNSLCPSPLRVSGTDQIKEETSRFSYSSSDGDSIHAGFRNSLKSRARKALHRRRSSVEAPEQRPSSSRSSHRRQSSLQQGLSDGIHDMYETLTSLSTTKTRRSRLSDELCSPPIPPKAAQILGTSSPIRSPKSPPPKTPKTPKSARFTSHHGYASVPFSENYLRPVTPTADADREPSSMAGKLALVFQNGTQQIEAAVGLGPEKVKRTKAEKRREELKKKIVVVCSEERKW